MRIFLTLLLIIGIYNLPDQNFNNQKFKVQYVPQENRGKEYQKWLSATVKISVNKTYGSGTIVYYDSSKNTAYIATCGHLWSGTMSATEGLTKNLTCKVTSWWQKEKLNESKSYTAKVLFFNNVAGSDTALLSFQPDWKPDFFPIASVNYQYKEGQYFHSLGCDGGREVAHYKIKVVGMQKNNLITIENSPRPGRSGGGLMNDEYYIGTCWGTSNTDGIGYGYFTPLKSIHSIWIKNGYEFLLKIHKDYIAQKIKIKDKNNSQKLYSKEYILIPNYVKE